LAGVLSLLLLSMPAAQNRTTPANPAADAQTPRTLDGKPSLNGFWVSRVAGLPEYHTGGPDQKAVTRGGDGSVFFDYGGAGAGVSEGENAPATGTPVSTPATRREVSEPSYKPEYAAKVKEIVATMYGSTSYLDPQLECKPNGVPRAGVFSNNGIMHIVQSPEAIAILYESSPGPYWRIIYTDGRGHPERLDTSYYGHSIGHWEGDTLVVDVVGLNDETWLGGGAQPPRTATIHSDQMHVVERWTRKGNSMTYEATVDDPVMFTKPWVITPQVTKLAPAHDYIQPQMCYGRDKEHIIQPTEKDQFCGTWCLQDPNAVYGGSSPDAGSNR
jgi:hypothetical protein